jgi:hypothetical protein
MAAGVPGATPLPGNATFAEPSIDIRPMTHDERHEMKDNEANGDRMLLTFLIQDRLYAFGRAVDTKQFSRLAETFAADVTGDYGYGRTHTGRDELIGSMEHHLGQGSNCGRSQHNVLNVQVSVDSDGVVNSRSNFYAVHEGVGRLQGEIWSTWGEYNDIWTLTPEGWRSRHRHYVTFFSEGPGDIVSRD